MWRRGGARRGPRGPAAVPPPPQSHLGRFVGHAALATTPGAGKRRASAKRGETPYTGAAQILQRRGRVAVLCPLQLHRRGFHLHYRCLRTPVVAAAADTAPSEPLRRGGCVACCTSVHRHRRFGVHVGQTASAVAAARHRNGPPPRLLHHLPHPDSRPAEVGAAVALVEAAMATLLVAPKAAARRVRGPARACCPLHSLRHYSRTTEAWTEVKAAASGCWCATAVGCRRAQVGPWMAYSCCLGQFRRTAAAQSDPTGSGQPATPAAERRTNRCGVRLGAMM